MLPLMQNIIIIWIQGALICLMGAFVLFRFVLSQKKTREEDFNGSSD